MKSLFFSTSRLESGFRHSHCQAFSLVEVVLALGIATFGILIIVGLLPLGIQSTKDSLEETGAINVLSAVIADRTASPHDQVSKVYNIPGLTNTLTAPATNYFGLDEANVMVNNLSQARYRVDYIVSPPGAGRADPYQAWFKVSWPAPSTNPAGFVEGVVTFPQP